MIRGKFISTLLLAVMQLACAAMVATTGLFPSAVAQEFSDFNVGAILHLSRPLADFGSAVRSGMGLAVKECRIF
jgi:hypothetical protein